MNINKFDVKNERNLTMLVDFYEFTMSQGFFKCGFKDTRVAFDMFYRKNPEEGGFVIFAGLEQLIEYINNLNFTKDDIEYLRTKNLFNEDFLNYLENFKFTGDIYSVKEGTPVFPYEPLLTIKAKSIDAQLIETMLLLTVNHQSLIATKANRVVRAAKGKTVLDFGARRAHGYDAAIMGARAAYIGGVTGTATTISDKIYGVPADGTMAHAWIQFHESEEEAFRNWATIYPDNCSLLVDTYNVLESGIPNAIKVADEILKPQGKGLKSIRLDSGDLTYLSIKARKMLDDAGYTDCKIVASNSLDEYTITSIENQGGKIDIYGVGERLITSKSEPVFGGVYKLVAVEKDGVMTPRIKISENIEKITNPGCKQVWRLFDRATHAAIADVITLENETIDDSKDYEIFDQVHIWKRKTVSNFYAVRLQVPVFINGECVYDTPSLEEIREYSKEQVDRLWNEVKRFDNPHKYYVDLSTDLWMLKNRMLGEIRHGASKK